MSKDLPIRIFVIADTHFNHKKMLEFGRPLDYEQRIKNNLTREVGRQDLLIHLGDVCIGNDLECNQWFFTLGCRNVLIRGNHDKKSVNWYLANGWSMVCERMDVNVLGKRVAFSHEPLPLAGGFDINYHGHWHDRPIEPWSDFHRVVSMEKTDYKPLLINRC